MGKGQEWCVKVGYVLLGLLVLTAVWAVIVFNRLVTHRNRMKEGWSGLEVQLKRRHDLIPALVKVVSAYGHHEKATMEGVMEKRAGALAAEGPGKRLLRSGGWGRKWAGCWRWRRGIRI